MSAVADKLREARALIERGWTQDAFDDQPYSGAPFTCVCALGAIMHAHGLGGGSKDLNTLAELPDTKFIQRAVGAKRVYGKMGPSDTGSVAAWNDIPGRTQAEVLAAFDKAIELAEKSA